MALHSLRDEKLGVAVRQALGTIEARRFHPTSTEGRRFLDEGLKGRDLAGERLRSRGREGHVPSRLDRFSELELYEISHYGLRGRAGDIMDENDPVSRDRS